MPAVMERVARVRKMRLASPKAATRESADRPSLFQEIKQPDTDYIIVPRVSSERREYVPLGFLPASVIASDAATILPDATMYDFGILNSQFHNAWMRTVAGRLKSDYRYSNTIVYNNFIWPEPTPEQRQRIEDAAQAILDTRAKYPESTLADLYDPLTMPPDLVKAHKALDREVEKAYGVNFKGDEQKIVAHLFELYAQATKSE
jgi:hypothetical protein